MIIYDRERLGEWAKQRIPNIQSWGEWYQAIGQIDKKINAAVIFKDYDGCNISMHIAAEGNWMNREFLDAVFTYPFHQLNVNRVTGYVGAKDDIKVKFYELLGFEREGMMRKGFADDDCVVMGLIKEDCRYGKIIESAACA